MFRHVFLTTVVVVVAWNCPLFAQNTMVRSWDIEVPILTGPIEQVDFQSAGAPILASDGNVCVLYDPVSEAALYMCSLSSGFENHDIIYADVNHDGAGDILIAYAFADDDSTCRVDFYDGAGGLSGPQTFWYVSSPYEDYYFEPAFNEVGLQEVDLDGDQSHELVLWYESTVRRNIAPGTFMSSTSGATVAYESFPGPPIWESSRLYDGLCPVSVSVDSMFFLTTRLGNDTWVMPASGLTSSIDRLSINVVSSDGTDTRIVLGVDSCNCDSLSSETVRAAELLHVDTLTAAQGFVRALARHSSSCTCFENNTVVAHSESSSLVLYGIDFTGAVDTIWQANDPGDLRDFFSDESYPGYLYGIGQDSIYTIDLAAGAIDHAIEIPPADTVFVVRDESEERDYVAVIKGAGLSLYVPGDQTDVSDDGDAVPLSFSLSLPHPNPFNPTVAVQVETHRSGHLRLAVFNALGQKVQVLVDRPVTSGSHRFEWSGDRFSSGIYLIRGDFEGAQQTVKAVLLK